MENYYELLNVSPSASKEELEKAILKQQRLWHSRVNSADFERRFRAEKMLRKLDEIQDVLLDDKKREAYNRNLLTLVISSYRPETVEQNKTILLRKKNQAVSLQKDLRPHKKVTRGNIWNFFMNQRSKIFQMKTILFNMIRKTWNHLKVKNRKISMIQ